MPIYNFIEQVFGPNRYGDGVDGIGIELWQRAFRAVLEGPPEALDWISPENPIQLFREDAEASFAGLHSRRPMVFVSHSHHDTPKALQLAQAIVADPGLAHYDVWLDIWDPALSGINASSVLAQRKALLIALAVEMGLLNSTHLVALYTRQSAGSAWIPYEYGRVKPKSVFAVNTAALLPPRKASLLPLPKACIYEPEYLELGKKFRSESEVMRWL